MVNVLAHQLLFQVYNESTWFCNSIAICAGSQINDYSFHRYSLPFTSFAFSSKKEAHKSQCHQHLSFVNCHNSIHKIWISSLCLHLIHSYKDFILLFHKQFIFLLWLFFYELPQTKTARNLNLSSESVHWQRCFLSFQGQNIHNRIPCKHNYHHLSDIFYILHTFICSQNCYFDYTSFWIIVKNLQKWMIEIALVLKKPNILNWKMLFQLFATSLGNLTSNTFQDYFHALIWIFECIIRSLETPF